MAVLVHMAWGGGADRAARVLEERLDVQRFAAGVRQYVAQHGGPIEISIEQAELEAPEPPDDSADPAAVKAPEAPTEEEPEPEQLPPEKKEEPKPKDEAKKKEEEKKKKDEEKAPAVVKQVPPAEAQRRIAVRQHVEDKDQENPEAEFIADEANRVAEQTQARITSTVENDPNPNPGSHQGGPDHQPGNADHTRVAQDRDAPGEPDRAPNDGTDGKEVLAQEASAAGTDQARDRANPSAPKPAQRPPLPAQAARPAREAQAEAPATPDTLHGESGSFGVAPRQEARPAQSAQTARKRRLPPPKQSHNDLFGFGAPGTTANGINLNLTPNTATAAIGRDTLARERRADAERRRSAHLGSWKSLGLERWRSAIENYVPNVKPGNQTALNTARVPFASYLNIIHNRLHPIFADSFLASLSSLPSSDPMNRRDLKTNLEIVLSQADGSLVTMGVTRASGVTAFDIAALESVKKAAPFGPPPREIVSPDGNVYFHWEFHREPIYACSTYFARPYILKVQPKTAPPEIEPPKPGPSDPTEDGAAPQRHGLLRSPRAPKLATTAP